MLDCLCRVSADTEQPGGRDKSIREVQGRQLEEILLWLSRWRRPHTKNHAWHEWYAASRKMKQNHHGSSDSKHGGLGSLFTFAPILQSLHLFRLLGANLTASLTNIIRVQIDFLLSQSLCLLYGKLSRPPLFLSPNSLNFLELDAQCRHLSVRAVQLVEELNVGTFQAALLISQLEMAPWVVEMLQVLVFPLTLL